jgi:hypothetical protein
VGPRAVGHSRPRAISAAAVTRTAWVTVSLVVVMLLGGSSVVSSGSADLPSQGPRPSPAAALGAFLGSDANGVQRIDDFSAWLGKEVTVGHTYLPGTSWRDIEGPDSILDPWTAWQSAKSGRTLVLNVPMLAPSDPAVGDDEAAELLRQGAEGDFDGHFQVLAQRLVERNAAQTIIVLGWEMNGTSYSGRCAPDSTAWKAFWRRIVSVMRGVPGQDFRFDFAPVRGTQAIPWPECYPGDDVVDIVGMDSYDQHPGRTFKDFIYQPYGLQDQAAFAQRHSKPISYPEWGLFDNGDNPAYINEMQSWISTHDVAYQTISDYCPHGVWRCADNPKSGQAYRELFGRVTVEGRPTGP